MQDETNTLTCEEDRPTLQQLAEAIGDLPSVLAADQRTHLERLEDDYDMLHGLIDYWSERARRAEEALKQLVQPKFDVGTVVSFKGRPAWGLGRVEVAATSATTCSVTWLRAHAEWEATCDVAFDDLEIEAQSVLQLALPWSEN